MRRRLAAAALLLAGAAAAAGPPRSPPPISALAVARHLVAGDSLRIMDLRTRAEWERYHLPGALHVTTEEARDAAPAFLTVLYGDGAAAAWRALAARGHEHAFVLEGGMHAWLTQVMEPALPPQPSSAERAVFDEAAELSRFFGGSPRIDGPRTGPTASEDEVTDALLRRGC